MRIFPQRWLPLLAVVLWMDGCSTVTRAFAPQAQAWERWLANNPQSNLVIDHRLWDRFLAEYLVRGADGIQRVAYGKVTAEDKFALGVFLRQMQDVPVSALNSNEQLAYWVNLYNAVTVAIVLQHYPVRSIRDIRLGGGWLTAGPWGAKLLHVEGQEVSLNDIEHRILRPLWKDPRIHYVLNCASLGCPNLRPSGVRGPDIQQTLDAAAREFINQPRAVAVRDGKLRVSSIYVWFRDDFGGDDRTVIAHLRNYAEPALAAKLAGVSRIVAFAYDWGLNDAR